MDPTSVNSQFLAPNLHRRSRHATPTTHKKSDPAQQADKFKSTANGAQTKPTENKFNRCSISSYSPLGIQKRLNRSLQREILESLPEAAKKVIHSDEQPSDQVINAMVCSFDWSLLGSQSSSFSNKTALGLSLLTWHAYEVFAGAKVLRSEHDVFGVVRGIVNQVSEHGEKGYSGRALIVLKDNQINVSLPGTRNFQDALRDFDCWKSKEEKGHVHIGFQKCADSLIPEINDAIEKLRKRYPDTRIRVSLSGHSMGGSIAMILANRLSNRPEIEIVSVYTFGSPKTFDKEEATNYAQKGLSQKTWRIINKSDFVSLIPDKCLSTSYQHTGNLVYVSSNDSVWKNPSHESMQKDQSSYSLLSILCKGWNSSLILDHSLRAYAKAMYLQSLTDQ